MGNETRRYDPNVHQNPSAYIEGFTDPRDRGMAIATVLSAAFTPYVESAYQNLLLEGREERLLIPANLSGNEPREITNFIPPGKEVVIRGIGNPGLIGGDNPPVFDLTFKKATSSVISDGHRLHREKDFFTIKLPVGNFGVDFAIALTQATRALYTVVPEEMQEAHEKALVEYTQQIIGSTYYAHPSLTFVDSMKSMAEAFAFLTNASVVPGYEDDPVGLFRLFIENGTFNKLGKVLMLSDLANITRDDLSPVNIIDPKTLSIKNDILKQFKKRQKIKRARAIKSDSKSTGHGCPAALGNTPAVDGNRRPYIIRESGINLGARIFVEYLDHYYKEAMAQPQTLETVNLST